MAIIGAHVLVYTPEPEQVRAVFRDVLRFDHVDSGGGWLIFKLPPTELGVHPSDQGAPHHEFSLMCDDIAATVADLSAKGITFTGPPEDRGFGVGTGMQLPGGLEVLLYEPRHSTAI